MATTHASPMSDGYNYGVPSLEVKGQMRGTPKMRKRRSGVDRIKVCVRKRPLSKREEKLDHDIVHVDPDQAQVLVKEEKLALDLRKVTVVHKFQFDEVFTEDVSNKAIYERTVKAFIPFIIRGGRATCFAFGQTGSGKTHTLLGDSSDRGLYQFAAEDLFSLLKVNPDGAVTWISYFEIYCGQLYDLLNRREKVKALENDKREVCITGVNEVPVSSPFILKKFIEQGNSFRSQGSSGVNCLSSRSHAVLQIQLKDVCGNKLGRLSIIDLAGSERACDRGDPDKATRQEGAEINTSLLSLKECIRALDQEHPHKPFRQSKLTQILRDSLMGEARTCMVANVSPGSSSIEDTLNTLRYAERVKEINGLTSNSHQPQDYTPKGFSPHNTSTPMKGRGGGVSPSTPERKRSSISGRRQSRDGSKKLSSPNARGKERNRSTADRKTKTSSSITKYNGGGDISLMRKNRGKLRFDTSDNGSSESSSLVHREVLLMHDNIRNEELNAGGKHGDQDGRQSVLHGVRGQSSTKQENSKLEHRTRVVRKFLSNSLPIWEDEEVEDHRLFPPNLSFAWEVNNPHYVLNEDEPLPGKGVGERTQEVNRHGGVFLLKESLHRKNWEKEQNGQEKESCQNELRERNSVFETDSKTQKSSKSWDELLDGKESGLMCFENPRYFKKNPRTQREERRAVRKGAGKLQAPQGLEVHNESNEGWRRNGEGGFSGINSDLVEKESPRSIVADNTMELIAEVDKALLKTMISNHSQSLEEQGNGISSGGGNQKGVGIESVDKERASSENDENMNDLSTVRSVGSVDGQTPRRAAFYRETLQPLTRQWQPVANNGDSPVSKVTVENIKQKIQDDSGASMNTNYSTGLGLSRESMDSEGDKIHGTHMESQEKIHVGGSLQVEEKTWYATGDHEGSLGPKVQVPMIERDSSQDSRAVRNTDGDCCVSIKDADGIEVRVQEKTTELDAKEHCNGSESSRPNGMVTPDDLKYGRFLPVWSPVSRPDTRVRSDGQPQQGSGNPLLSPISERTSENGQSEENGDAKEEVGDERFERSPSPFDRSPSPPGRPSSALERSTVCTDLTNKESNARDLIISTHREHLKELQRLCDSGWEIMNRLDQGQMDIPHYVSEAERLLERQQSCIETFQKQIAMYTTFVDDRLEEVPVRDSPENVA